VQAPETAIFSTGPKGVIPDSEKESDTANPSLFLVDLSLFFAVFSHFFSMVGGAGIGAKIVLFPGARSGFPFSHGGWPGLGCPPPFPPPLRLLALSPHHAPPLYFINLFPSLPFWRGSEAIC